MRQKKQGITSQLSAAVRPMVMALAVSLVCLAQGPSPQQPAAPAATPPAGSSGVTDMNLNGRDPAYVLGPSDVVVIRAAEVEEIGATQYVVDSDGVISLPTLGKVKAGGLTISQLESTLAELLKKYVREPEVIVAVGRMRSDPIFFTGAFKNPGIYPLQGRRTLVEMLSSIGGLQPNARRRLKIARRKERGRLPLPNAVDDAEGRVSTAEISLNSLQQAFDPAEDVELRPYDSITVARSEMVYVAGEFGKVGGFELEERESLSVTQLIALAGGLSKDAAPDKARVLRPVLDTSRRAEIPVNIKDILAGKGSDYPLLANDMLYVPASRRKAALSRTLQMTAPLVPALIFLGMR